MKINEKLKVMLKSMLSIKLSEVITDKGTLIYDAETLEIGVEVFVTNENGEIEKAEDGEYVGEEVTIVVVDGKVAEIIENPSEEEEVEKSNEEETIVEETIVEETMEAKVDVNVEDPTTDPIEEEVVEENVEIPSDKLEEILETLTSLNNKILSLEGKITELEERLMKVEKEPATNPIEEEEVETFKMSRLSYLKK